MILAVVKCLKIAGAKYVEILLTLSTHNIRILNTPLHSLYMAFSTSLVEILQITTEFFKNSDHQKFLYPTRIMCPNRPRKKDQKNCSGCTSFVKKTRENDERLQQIVQLVKAGPCRGLFINDGIVRIFGIKKFFIR